VSACRSESQAPLKQLYGLAIVYGLVSLDGNASYDPQLGIFHGLRNDLRRSKLYDALVESSKT